MDTPRILEHGRYAGVYDTVTGLASKKDLDLTILDNLPELPPGSKLIDFGCGPAQKAMALAEEGHTVIGVDISSDMFGLPPGIEPPEGFSFIQADLTDTQRSARQILTTLSGEHADAGIAVNSFYMSTLPEETPGHTLEELQPLPLDKALEKRRQFLHTIACTLKPGATIVLSEPLGWGRELGTKGIANVIADEWRAAGKLGIPRLRNIFRNLFSIDTWRVVKENKVFRPLVHLFDSVEQIKAFLEEEGLFEVQNIIEATPENRIYGSCSILVAKRTDVEVQS